MSLSSKLLVFITYADVTTLSGLLSGKFTDNDVQHINSELNNISDWLKINKLSLYVQKNKGDDISQISKEGESTKAENM